MSMAKPFKAECVVPILRVEDIQASFRYYTEKLLFEKKWDWGEPPGFGCVGVDEVEIFLSEKGQGCPGVWMSIFIDNVDDYHAKIVETGAKVVREPRDEVWGVREMHVEDPDGHIIRFSQGLGESE